MFDILVMLAGDIVHWKNGSIFFTFCFLRPIGRILLLKWWIAIVMELFGIESQCSQQESWNFIATIAPVKLIWPNLIMMLIELVVYNLVNQLLRTEVQTYCIEARAVFEHFLAVHTIGTTHRVLWWLAQDDNGWAFVVIHQRPEFTECML